MIKMQAKTILVWIAVLGLFKSLGCVHFDFQRVRDWGGNTVSELRSEGIRSPQEIETWIYEQENGFDIHKGTLALLWIATRRSGQLRDEAIESYFNVFEKTHEGWPRDSIIPAYSSYGERPHSREQYFRHLRGTMVRNVVVEKWLLRRKRLPRDVSGLVDVLSRMKELGGFREGALRPAGYSD